MSCLCIWLPETLGAAGRARMVVNDMGTAMRVNPKQRWASFQLEGIAVGVLGLPSNTLDTPSSEAPAAAEPAVVGIGRHYLWMAGEAYASRGLVKIESVEETHTLAFRQRLLEALLDRGPEAIDRLDGAFQIALWDAEERRLTLLNDRFGSLPLYLGSSREGLSFAGGVRGVLMAPGIDPSPDPEALREAVSFGGYRLGERTNVLGVEMVPAGSILDIHAGKMERRRYLHWPRKPTSSTTSDVDEQVEEVRELWRQAVYRRMPSVDSGAGIVNAGQTLSGGLDSRAILAEATVQSSRWNAVTYGVAGCDDADFARQAAREAGAEWKFVSLYDRRAPDWLDRRTVHIQATDGLIQLTDLMHLECLSALRSLDLQLSGYIGDMVCGNTFEEVRDAPNLLARLPFSGSPLGWSSERADHWARAQMLKMGDAPSHFVMFEHKLPQSIHRIFQAYDPWMRVRKPFLDYDLFDYFAVLDGSRRIDLYHRMLKSTYPKLFAIPDQRTGMPILTPDWRIQVERARRLATRKAAPWLARIGVEAKPRVRSYFDEETHWRQPDARRRIEGVILAPGSVPCEILGRDAVTTAVEDWFDRGIGPVQVIAALYVFEVYHRDLPSFLEARKKA